MDEKDKKIQELRSLLSTAKNKLEELKAMVISRDKEIVDIKAEYDAKIKDLENTSNQIIKQYEERQLRYQKSLEDSENRANKFQAQAIANSRSNQKICQSLTQIGNITMRIFTLNKIKDNSEAVEELCNIQKCKQFVQEIEKVDKNDQIGPAIKTILKLTDLFSQSLAKKRESRLLLVKKEGQFKKSVEEEQERTHECQRRISELQKELKSWQAKWVKKIEQINENKEKMKEQKVNVEFIKQLLLKIFMGPKEASVVALDVLGRVLNMNEDETKLCSKKIK